jgi:hypothetical protein
MAPRYPGGSPRILMWIFLAFVVAGLGLILIGKWAVSWEVSFEKKDATSPTHGSGDRE